MFLLTSFVLYAFALQVVHALPILKRIVVSPQITKPLAGTSWTPGETELVTWDTSAIPSTGDFTGKLVLGFLTPGSENLDYDHPLAEGFSLRDGSISVTCPRVAPRDNYIVVLFGDSGNKSPQFTITGPPASGNSEPPASPSSQPSSTEPMKPQLASTTPMTSPPSSYVSAALDSGLSTLSRTPSAQVDMPTLVSPTSSYATSSTSPSKESSADSNSSPANSKSNNAIPRTWSMGTIVTSAIVTIFTIFTF